MIRFFVFLFYFTLSLVFAQNQIQGNVFANNQDGSTIPLTGANIFWEGTSLGTVSDIDGNELMSIPELQTDYSITYFYSSTLSNNSENILDFSYSYSNNRIKINCDEQLKLELYNLTGQKLFSRDLFFGENMINVDKFENKIIVMKFYNDDGDTELKKIVDQIYIDGVVAIDCETTSLSPTSAKILGFSMSINNSSACYIPINHANINAKLKQLEQKTFVKVIKPLLEDPSILKIGQNIKYDLIILQRMGIDVNNIDDTMLMSYVLDAGKNRHNMDTLSEIHLGHKTISYKDLVGVGKKQINFSEVKVEVAKDYAAEDADITFRLYKKFLTNLKNEKIMNIYETFEKPLIKILAHMEMNGIKLDKKFLNKLSENFQKKISDLEKKIFKISKKEFKIGSTKQLGEVLYNDLKISALKKTKKGSFATGASVLEDLAYKGHELPQLVLEWRQLTKLKNTYSDSLPEFLNPNTSRVHTSFLLAATTTGRLASSDPNLQNIPIKSNDGKEIRKAFISDKGCNLLSADYNQIEMRILADLADVKELKKAFNNKEDIHSLTASQVFNVKIKDVTSELRRKAKAINFGIIYGISQYGLAKQISVTTSEADEFLKSYFKKFPEIKDYMSTTINFCRKSGYVNNIFGRRTHITGINDKNFNVRNFQERAAINAPIQGSASELMRMAMINIFEKIKVKKIKDCKLLLQIHDELIFEVKKDNIENIKKLVENGMKSVQKSDLHSFSIPILVDVNIGENWGLLQ